MVHSPLCLDLGSSADLATRRKSDSHYGIIIPHSGRNANCEAGR
jgi:hypothetical protein